MRNALLRWLGAAASLGALAVPVTGFAQAIGDNHARLPFHLDSAISLGLVGYAVVVAVMLNHRVAGFRVAGILAAAFGCLAVAAAIVGLDLGGQFAEMRPPRYSIDPFKPILMRFLAVTFLLAAVVLLLVAQRQSQRSDQLVLAARNEPVRYGYVSRLFHWTIAILFLLLVPMGVFTTMLPYDVGYRQAFYVIHKSVGLTVFLLAAARLVWVLLSPRPPLAAGLKGWERLFAHSAHYAFYLFLFVFPISGYVLGTSLGKLSHFYFWDLPMLWGPGEESLSAARLMHKLVLPFAFYFLFLGHVLGAAKHQYVDGHNDSFRRMVT